jgi:hypothetical protein
VWVSFLKLLSLTVFASLSIYPYTLHIPAYTHAGLCLNSPLSPFGFNKNFEKCLQVLWKSAQLILMQKKSNEHTEIAKLTGAFETLKTYSLLAADDLFLIRSLRVFVLRCIGCWYFVFSGHQTLDHDLFLLFVAFCLRVHTP